MSPFWILVIVILYFGVLITISRLTSKDDNASFFLGNKKSPWFVVAFGMIGASLSGITFISIPGWVGGTGFSYMQMVFGYVFGYLFISYVLMPIYYRLNLTSIYSYLEGRFGSVSYYTGASFFLISRTIGAAFRLYLVAMVFKYAIFDQLNVSWLNELNRLSQQINFDLVFALTVFITIALIWVYTSKGGIGTIIWTDTLQTFFMLLSVILTIVFILNDLDWSFFDLYSHVKESNYSGVFFFSDSGDARFFPKKFIAGIFMAIVMTGLDQDMMQKNLSCKNIKDAQKNMNCFSIVLVGVNFVFLVLGALLFIYSDLKGINIPEKTDMLFPTIALNALGGGVAVFFILGLIAAAYSSADSALTSLTTSFSVDILRIETNDTKVRKKVHKLFSVVLFVVIIIFERINDNNVVSTLFMAAGYTYGPLLGLYAFGIFTKRRAIDGLVPFMAILSCGLSYALTMFFDISFELLIYNGLIMSILLFISSFKNNKIGL